MNAKHLFRIAVCTAGLALATPGFASPLPSATATYTAVSDPVTSGLYDYTLTLTNTGTTTIGEFWFAWIPGKGFLTVAPTTESSPAGWTATYISAAPSVQWIDNSTLLQPGQTLTGFSFDSTETPGQFNSIFTGTGTGSGDSNSTAFVYVVTKVATDPGDQFVATQVTPEPGSLLLALTGSCLGAVARFRSRGRRRG